MNFKRNIGIPNILLELHPKKLMAIKKDYELTESELLFLQHLHENNRKSNVLFYAKFK
jgi:hypothetical protein